MKSHLHNRPRRVGLLSLGCAKNLVDSEIILGTLLEHGLEVINESAAADVVIVNSCSFIDAAQQESIDAILESDAARAATNPRQALIVAGCLPQRFREELPKLLPEVDAFMGIDQLGEVAAIVERALANRQRKIEALAGSVSPRKIKKALRTNGRSPGPESWPAIAEVSARPTYIPDYATPRFRLTPKHFAYLKIAEGCNHPCTFCIIPRMRGSHRSRLPADILREAASLIEQGVKEINLISQDSTYYGLDLRPQRMGSISSPQKFRAASAVLPEQSATLPNLLRELNDLPGKFWIRLLYTHPAHWTPELIQTIRDCPKVARYIDLPLQHIHDDMLERMRRETSRQYIMELIQQLRAGIPGITLRTTFIVGFPGENDEHFQSLLEFIRATRFERLGVFAYSQEEGTRAGRMGNQVPSKVKEHRCRLAMLEQRKIARSISQSFVGRDLTALVEGKAASDRFAEVAVVSWEHGHSREIPPKAQPAPVQGFAARGEGDAPDIDGRIYIRGRVTPGEFAQVKVVAHTDYDLVAESI